MPNPEQTLPISVAFLAEHTSEQRTLKSKEWRMPHTRIIVGKKYVENLRQHIPCTVQRHLRVTDQSSFADL